jgi:iron complex outermembrane receptor protein
VFLDAPSFDFIVSGDTFAPRDGLTYNYAPTNHMIRPSERLSAGFLSHYEYRDNHEAYAEFSFMDHQTDAQIAPSGAFFVTGTLNCSNPLLSAQQLQVLCTDRGFAPTDTVIAYVGRRNVEGAPRSDDVQHTAFRAVMGLRGDINDTWSYDAFYNRGETNYQETYQNDLSTTVPATQFANR